METVHVQVEKRVDCSARLAAACVTSLWQAETFMLR